MKKEVLKFYILAFSIFEGRSCEAENTTGMNQEKEWVGGGVGWGGVGWGGVGWGGGGDNYFIQRGSSLQQFLSRSPCGPWNVTDLKLGFPVLIITCGSMSSLNNCHRVRRRLVRGDRGRSSILLSVLPH